MPISKNRKRKPSKRRRSSALLFEVNEQQAILNEVMSMDIKMNPSLYSFPEPISTAGELFLKSIITDNSFEQFRCASSIMGAMKRLFWKAGQPEEGDSMDELWQTYLRILALSIASNYIFGSKLDQESIEAKAEFLMFYHFADESGKVDLDENHLFVRPEYNDAFHFS